MPDSFTPGPWQVGALGMIHDCSGPEPIYSRRVAIAYGQGGEPGACLTREAAANARLIAAAPCLLIACEVALDDLESLSAEGVSGCQDAIEALRAALKKARDADA